MTLFGIGIIAVLLYILGAVALVVIAVLSWIFWDKRFKSNQYTLDIPHGFIKTEEFFIDPTTQRKVSVYYNATTGERFYKDETEKRS